jgi:hypothetical protein
MLALLSLLTTLSWFLAPAAGGVDECCRACVAYYTEPSKTLEQCRAGECVDLTCPLGQYLTLTECDFLSSTQTLKCTDCRSGTYRDNLDIDPVSCLQCATCLYYQLETSACTKSRNTVCQTCEPGKIKENGRCRSCESESYTTDRISCSPCTSCTNMQYQTAACLSYQNRQCLSCPTGKVTQASNSQTCDKCADGWYELTGVQSFTCLFCNNPANPVSCPKGYWLKCEGGTKQCLPCDGFPALYGTNVYGTTVYGKDCGLNSGVSGSVTGKCDGLSRVNFPCAVCPPGSERISETPLDAGAQVCVKCDTGKYKTASMTACMQCDSLPSFSVYRAYSPTEVADKNQCPFECNAGYFKLMAKPINCPACPSTGGDICSPCLTGTYKSSQGNDKCLPCTNKARDNSYYLARANDAPTITDSCPW